MALATYNGFTGAQRMAVHRWQLAEFAAGRLARPDHCDVCGQTDGAFDAHCEDYDQPARFFPLCLTCHLTLHARFTRRALFAHYRAQVSRGWQAPPLPRDGGFSAWSRTIAAGRWPTGTWGPPRGRTLLDELPLERGVPARFLMPA